MVLLQSIISLLLIALILQVGAVSPDRGAQKQHNLALADVDKSFAKLKGLYDGAKTVFDQFQSCGIGTHLEIYRLATEKLSDYESCANATREIANYEEFLFHLYYYGKFVGSTVIDVVKNILDCRHQSGVFSILNCTVTEVQSSGPQFDEILSRAKSLIAEVAQDTDNLIYYTKRCFWNSSSEFLSEMHNLIKKC